MPQWRIDLADRSAYPVRSLCAQHQETDLAFLQRLWAEEGLFAWFTHEGAPRDATLGQHTLVLAAATGASSRGGEKNMAARQTAPNKKAKPLTQPPKRLQLRQQPTKRWSRHP
ncbi:MAG: contractile injection system protein, VgrG/Pvc8 family [Aquabacterium sp.]